MGRFHLAGKALPRIDFTSREFFQTRFSIDSYLETSTTSGSLRGNRRMAGVTA
jgi:hypothetical protein